MRNVVKCYKDFFGYFNALKTHGEYLNFQVIIMMVNGSMVVMVISP